MANAGVDTLYGSLGNTITIGGTPTGSGGASPYTYSWSPSTKLSSDTAANPIDTVVLDTSQYIVTVTDNNGCTQKDTSVVIGIISVRPGLSVETSGCPGSTLTICINNAEMLVGKQIHINNIVTTGCGPVIEITEETTCIECQIVSLYGVPSISVVDPNTGTVFNDLIVIQ